MSDGQPLRGVNLGGWLVLERWMTPSVFAGYDARDEYELSKALGNAAPGHINAHRERFITEADIAWLAAHGVQALRVPVPYWLVVPEPPYVGGLEHLDWLFKAAQVYNLRVLLCLHAAPGSQNGWDHSGRSGAVDWDTAAHKQRTIDVLRALAERYGGHPALWALELLNEPHPSLPLKHLDAFYVTATDAVRQIVPDVQVVWSDSFRPAQWRKAIITNMPNTAVDMHLYQAFTDEDKRLTITQHVHKAAHEWATLIADMRRRHHRVIVGEWSLGIEPQSYSGMDEDAALSDYATAQLQGFATADAWFFWSYRTETMVGWSYRDCVERGWLPQAY